MHMLDQEVGEGLGAQAGETKLTEVIRDAPLLPAQGNSGASARPAFDAFIASTMLRAAEPPYKPLN
jgi:hypothetical protein